MASFQKDYSRYYDLLYQDKDYKAEADYIHSLIQKHKPGAKTILELGCGSGKYTSLLAQYGYEISGIDLSSSMIDIAREKYPNICFEVAGIEDFSLGRQFDLIISFFHVMSYQHTNDALTNSFTNIHKHLKPGGIFLFDCWYGPAVLSERPSTRIKRVQDGELSITRLAEPVMYPNENLVDVNYEMIVRDSESFHTFKETHKMRYFFTPEIELIARFSGFSLETHEEFLSTKELNFSTWGGAFCLRKINLSGS